MNERDRMPAIKGGKPSARHRGSKASKRAGAARASRTVRNVMVSDVVTIGPSASRAAADRDIVVRAVARDADTSVTRVDECLTPGLVCAHPSWTTDQAMHAMSGAQVGRLPVVDDAKRLVGIVTLSSMAFRAPDKFEALESTQEVSRRSPRAAA